MLLHKNGATPQRTTGRDHARFLYYFNEHNTRVALDGSESRERTAISFLVVGGQTQGSFVISSHQCKAVYPHSCHHSLWLSGETMPVLRYPQDVAKISRWHGRRWGINSRRSKPHMSRRACGSFAVLEDLYHQPHPIASFNQQASRTESNSSATSLGGRTLPKVQSHGCFRP